MFSIFFIVILSYLQLNITINKINLIIVKRLFKKKKKLKLKKNNLNIYFFFSLSFFKKDIYGIKSFNVTKILK